MIVRRFGDRMGVPGMTTMRGTGRLPSPKCGRFTFSIQPKEAGSRGGRKYRINLRGVTPRHYISTTTRSR